MISGLILHPCLSYLVVFHSMHSTLSEGGEHVFNHWQVVVVHLLGSLKQLLLLRLHGRHHLGRRSGNMMRDQSRDGYLCVVGVVEQRIGEASLSLAQA